MRFLAKFSTSDAGNLDKYDWPRNSGEAENKYDERPRGVQNCELGGRKLYFSSY